MVWSSVLTFAIPTPVGVSKVLRKAVTTSEDRQGFSSKGEPDQKQETQGSLVSNHVMQKTRGLFA
jgi:hypothetical protein